MRTSCALHRTNRGQIFDRLNIRAFGRSVNRTGQKFQRHETQVKFLAVTAQNLTSAM